MTMLVNEFVQAVTGNIFVRLLAVVICADMIFGSLRAARFRCWNSAVGIDGGIRKVGMVAGMLLLSVTDLLVPLNLIGWVQEDIAQVLRTAGILKIGVTELFCMLFILYELTSVLKNMLLCGMPIPAVIRRKAAQWLTDMTEETHVSLEEMQLSAVQENKTVV